MGWSSPPVIEAGNVEISAGTVDVQNAPGTSLSALFGEVLLATVPGATTSVVVPIPAGCQALAVLSPDPVIDITVTGSTSGVAYPVRTYSPHVVSRAVAMIDDSVDAEATVDISSVVGKTWYVIALLGTQAVAAMSASEALVTVPVGDTLAPQYATLVAGMGGFEADTIRALLMTNAGIPYGVPSVPGTSANDHPPNELQSVQVGASAAGAVILPAPGAGLRTRLFHISALPEGLPATNYQVLVAGITLSPVSIGVAFSTGAVYLRPIDVPLSGLACAEDTALTVYLALDNSWNFFALYTTETV